MVRALRRMRSRPTALPPRSRTRADVAELLEQAIHHTEHLRMEAAYGSQAV